MKSIGVKDAINGESYALGNEKNEFDFAAREIYLQNPKNHQILKINNCPSLADVLPTIVLFVNAFLVPFHSALCLYYRVSGKVKELTEIEFQHFANSFEGYQVSFLVIFESIADSTSWIFWRLEDTKQIFIFNVTENVSNFGEFVRDFLFKTLKEGYTGINSSIHFLKNRLRIPVCLEMFSDGRRYNLLFIAAEGGHTELVKYLIKKLSVKKSVKRKAAIDLAYENKHFDVVLVLLKANSRFPDSFILPQSGSEELRNFLLTLWDLHRAIRSKNENTVERIIQENPGLSFFYDPKNNSALAVAITSKSFKIYEMLITRNISLGPHELIDDLLEKLNFRHRKQLSDINRRNFKAITDKHILELMANVNVGFDDENRQTRLNIVSKAFQRLNTIAICRLILQIFAATRIFEITFDFNRDHVQFLDPRSEAYTNGVFYFSGKIYIGAMHLLDETRFNEVLGVIIHEFCHFVMFKIFGNDAKPYGKNESQLKEEFKRIISRCKELKGFEQIICWVYDNYDEDQFPAELIVRYAHMLAQYIDDPQRMQELERIFADLVNYFNNRCLPVMRQKLPEIERESEERIRREYAKPSTVLRLYWKWILAFLIVIGSALLVFLLHPCLVKSCGSHSFVFCENSGFNAVCKCAGNMTYVNQTCHECVHNIHCFNDQICSNLKCYDQCKNAECDAHEHSHCVMKDNKPSCECKNQLKWYNNSCHECIASIDCLPSKTCKDMMCINPCDNYLCHNQPDALCSLENGKPTCKCRNNFKWIEESCLECIKNSNCPSIKVCNNLKCVDPCTKLDCGTDKNAYGLAKNHTASCNCINSLKWINDRCLECDNDNDCPHSLICMNSKCFNEKDIISCKNGQRTLNFLMCDGNDDCDDKSDETRCVKGSIENIEFHRKYESYTLLTFKPFDNTTIDDEYFGIASNVDESVKGFEIWENAKVKFLPNSFSKKFPKLVDVDVRECSVSKITAKNFEGLGDLKEINLGDNQIGEIEKGSFDDLRSLEELHLSRNKLRNLDENLFTNLINLRTLDLGSNQLTTFIENSFRSLEYLVLSKNQISSLPWNIFSNLKQLKKISLDRNKLIDLDENLLTNLINLQLLDLHSNQLTTLHENLFHSLEKLEYLDLSENQISSLPWNIFSNLKQLKKIYLNVNKLKILPEKLFENNQKLEVIWLFNNEIEKIPSDLFDNLSEIKSIGLEGNKCINEEYGDSWSSPHLLNSTVKAQIKNKLREKC